MAGLNGEVRGGAGLEAALKRIERMASAGPRQLRVGFLENARYPDGTLVAKVAAIQNYGAPAASIPARPFFSNFVRQDSPAWGEKLARISRAADYDPDVSLGRMGEYLKGGLQASIVDTNDPPLSPVTLMLRKMRSEDQSLVVTGRTVGEAARRVAAGESTAGVSTKPLDDTAHMLNSVDYEVGSP